MCERETLLRAVAHRAFARLARRGEALDERLATACKDAHVIRRVPCREREQFTLEVGPAEVDAHAGLGGFVYPSPANAIHCDKERVSRRRRAAAFEDPGTLLRDRLPKEIRGAITLGRAGGGVQVEDDTFAEMRVREQLSQQGPAE